LKSGLTASITIQCSRLSGVLQVPVQAIYAHGDKMYCFVHDANGWEARQVTPGPTNDKFFVIESGLNDGDRVALNPRGYVDQVKLPELSPEEKQRAVQRGPQDSLDQQGMGEDGPSVQGGPPMRGQGGRRGRRGAGDAGGPAQRSAGLTEPNAPVDENVEPAAQQSAGATQ
jgi:hypothetical protein